MNKQTGEYQTPHFILRPVQEHDAESLLTCYSDSATAKFINKDNCDYGFHYETRESMRNCIMQWIKEYEKGSFIRLIIIERNLNRIAGTIEICTHTQINPVYGKVGILRIDVLSTYEYAQFFSELLPAAEQGFKDIFPVDCIITKAIPEAAERRKALKTNGFLPLKTGSIIPWGDYFICSGKRLHE